MQLLCNRSAVGLRLSAYRRTCSIKWLTTAACPILRILTATKFGRDLQLRDALQSCPRSRRKIRGAMRSDYEKETQALAQSYVVMELALLEPDGRSSGQRYSLALKFIQRVTRGQDAVPCLQRP